MARNLSTRAHQAGRKAVLMLGEAGEHAGFVGAASSANRATFVVRDGRRVVDQTNLMTYDMAGPYSGWVTWHSSALLDNQPNHPSSFASSAQIYRNVGVPAAKLGIGIGFYGTCWRGAGTIWRGCRT